MAGPAHQLAMRMRTVNIALASLNGRLPPVNASEVASRNDYNYNSVTSVTGTGRLQAMIVIHSCAYVRT